jgi:hypothetical protein
MNEKLDINVGSREKRAIILEFNIQGGPDITCQKKSSM